MDPKAFVEIRMKRCMASTLEEFERQIEKPLRELQGTLSNGVTSRRVTQLIDGADEVKRTFRKRIQAFAADVSDVMPTDVEINGFEPVVRR